MAVDRRTVLQNAQLFASKGRYEAAIAEWRKLTTDTPADGTIFNSIGDLQLKRNATPDAVSAFLQAAGAFRSEGSVLKAIAAYKKILKDPTRIEIYRHLGDLNAERGLLSSAVQDYLTLGKHYSKDGRNAEALEIYRKIVAQDPRTWMRSFASRVVRRGGAGRLQAVRISPARTGTVRRATIRSGQGHVRWCCGWIRRTPRPKKSRP